MQNVAELVDRFGGAAKMAAVINQAPEKIRQWSARNSVPGRYWLEIIAAARQLGIKGVNASTLTELASQRKAA